MAFTQVIEVRASNVEALEDHVAAFHSAERGRAPGYRGARVLEDGERPGTYLIEVDFDSAELAKQNSARAETDAWARKLGELIEGDPVYRNLIELCTTKGE